MAHYCPKSLPEANSFKRDDFFGKWLLKNEFHLLCLCDWYCAETGYTWGIGLSGLFKTPPYSARAGCYRNTVGSMSSGRNLSNPTIGCQEDVHLYLWTLTPTVPLSVNIFLPHSTWAAMSSSYAKSYALNLIYNRPQCLNLSRAESVREKLCCVIGLVFTTSLPVHLVAW